MMGNGFHSILVGVDESANAQKAFQYAVKKLLTKILNWLLLLY